MLLESYLNLKARNDRMKKLRAQGYHVTVYTSRNQQIHPQYINDWKGPEKDDIGFGNTVYKTFVAKLYCLRASHTNLIS